MSSMYSTRDAFELYSYYMAIKKHFTSTYDFVKYGGKMRLTVDGFENRKDKFFFYKLSKRKDAKDFISKWQERKSDKPKVRGVMPIKTLILALVLLLICMYLLERKFM